MKIESVRAWHLEHPEARLVEDGTTPPLPPRARGRRQLAVQVIPDAGPTGLAVGYAPPGALVVVNEALKPLLSGQDPFIVGELWAEMMWMVRDYGRGGVALQAISTVDLALWDLKARAEERSLCDVLGRLRKDVVVYGSGGFTSFDEDELVAEMVAFVEAGFRAVKMKVGKSFGTCEAEDLARVRAVREAIGPGIELYVDANGAYGVEQAVRMAERFALNDVGLFEEPVPADDVAGLATVRSRSPVPIATGEHQYEASGVTRLAEAGATDVMQLDILRIGGVTGWLRAVAIAAEHGLPVMSHAGQLFSLQAGCATPGFAAAEFMNIQAELDHLWYEEVPEPIDGRLAPLEGRPGLGLKVRGDIA